MRTLLALLAASAFSAPLAHAAPQSPYGVYLDFEDLTGSGVIPDDYSHVESWGGWTYTDVPDANFPAQTGAVRITAATPQARIEFGESITFDRAAVVTAGPLAFKFFYQGQHVHTSATIQPNVGGPPAFLISGYANFVDALEVVTDGSAFVMDDFDYVAGYDGTGGFGQVYCTALPNSTGVSSVMYGSGSRTVAQNDLTLHAVNLPPGQFGMFLVSREEGFVPLVGGQSNGNLCLGSTIGRFTLPSQIRQVDSSGEFNLNVDLLTMPLGSGTVSVASGETWRFQAWHRDSVGQGNNLSAGLELSFF